MPLGRSDSTIAGRRRKLPRNVEIKARVESLGAVRERALAAGARAAGVLRQVDRYFTLDGARREKLRTIDDERFEWIRYERPEEGGIRESDYTVERLARGDAELERLLAAPPLRIVAKRRELLLLGNVRIHLDRVDGLGDFLELEAVVDETHDEAACHAAVERLIEVLGIERGALLRASYSELAR